MNFQAAVEITSVVRRWRGYPDYKDSGVDWLRKIPAQWEAKKIKRLCLVKRGASPRPIEDPIYFDDEGEYSWVRISDVTASTKYLERTEQRLSEHGKSKSVPLEPGELFLSIAATVGKPIITRIKCCIHDGFVCFVGLKENREYLFYLFSSGELYKGIGKTGTQLNLNTDTIGDVRIPVPSSEEQNTIAAFLDRETAKIDALVAKKERLIELLQEKRAALITRAVTKGLPSTGSGQATPNVPMKDSGVEWLGEIPAHWEVSKLKRVCSLLRDGTHQPPARTLVGVPLLSVRNIVNGRFTNLPDDSLISEKDFNALERAFSVKENDVLLAIVGATLGKVAIVEEMPPFAIQRSLAVLRPRPSLVEYRFLSYFLQSSVFQRVLWQSVGFSAQPGIYLGTIENLVCLTPPITEQTLVVEAIDFETNKIDSLIAKIREGIQKLKEYRTALISAAVTGKIDVREEICRMADSPERNGANTE